MKSPEEIYKKWSAVESGAEYEAKWNALFAEYKKAYPELAAEFERRMKGDLPCDLKAKTQEWIKSLQANPQKIATRKAGQIALDFFVANMPELVGGSADLAPSNLTMTKVSKSIMISMKRTIV